MIRSVVQVVARKDFKVFVYFDDGKIKLFDLAPLIKKGGVFSKISDMEYFLERCTVMNGTLAWDLSGTYDPTQCLDIDAESIYLNGVDVSEPLDLSVA